MTFLQIQETIEQIFPIIGRTQIKKDVNEVYREFCQRTEMIKTYDDETIVADTVEYTLPTDMDVPTDIVYYDSSSVILLKEDTLRHQITQNKILFLDYYYTQITEIPSAISTIRYYYKKIPVALSGSADVPAIPSQFHNALVEGVLAIYYARFPSLDRPTQTGMMKVRDMQASRMSRAIFQEYIVKGKMYAIGNVVQTTDPTSDTVFVKRSYVYKFRLTPPATFAISDNNKGFSGTITPTLSGDTITLTSADSEFDTGMRVEDTQGGAQRLSVTSSLYKILLPPEWENDWDNDEIVVFKEAF